MTNAQKIRQLIDTSISKCLGWVGKDINGNEIFIDPNDKEEISAHYGATHAAASFIIWGKFSNDELIYQKGTSLLKSIIDRWDKNKILPDFHFDFNNFALTIIANIVDEELANSIKSTVLNSSDSNHDTINWLPMRWAVNKKRIEWTGDKKYQITIDKCRKIISEATNADGGIEDRIPRGVSFNLQYDLATVAVLQYLRSQGEIIDLSNELGFLLNCVAPDGDINYHGRGTNQIFAYGLWIYLLSSSCQERYLTIALDYLVKKFPSMIDNNNMMLNDWDGKEKYLWWDYHYTSVYTAHFLLWLMLAYRDMGTKKISPIKPTTSETGMHIYRSEKAFVSWFEGRSEYLAEKGPAITAIWTKKNGMICKGAFGPWQGTFGNKYSYEDVVLKNYCGLLEVQRNIDWSKNKYIHKLMPLLESPAKQTIKPVFCPIEITEKYGELTISWNCSGCSETIFNMPSFTKELSIEMNANGKKLYVNCVEALKNQYNWVWLFQTRPFICKIITIVIK